MTAEPTSALDALAPRKYLTLLALVVGSGLALLAWTQTWFTVHLTAAATRGARSPSRARSPRPR